MCTGKGQLAGVCYGGLQMDRGPAHIEWHCVEDCINHWKKGRKTDMNDGQWGHCMEVAWHARRKRQTLVFVAKCVKKKDYAKYYFCKMLKMEGVHLKRWGPLPIEVGLMVWLFERLPPPPPYVGDLLRTDAGCSVVQHNAVPCGVLFLIILILD